MTTIPQELVPDINQALELALPETTSAAALKEKLSLQINELINHDFEKLVFYLYRIDVDEARMRALLAHKEGEGAAGLIAELVIERQLQKIKARNEFKQKATEGNGEEKW
ncbi:MAG: hypothetical protein J0M10_14945 [Chitinophagales bacterium]|nr:hypothetical protein [Chitinophagales bacterium]